MRASGAGRHRERTTRPTRRRRSARPGHPSERPRVPLRTAAWAARAASPAPRAPPAPARGVRARAGARPPTVDLLSYHRHRRCGTSGKKEGGGSGRVASLLASGAHPRDDAVLRAREVGQPGGAVVEHEPALRQCVDALTENKGGVLPWPVVQGIGIGRRWLALAGDGARTLPSCAESREGRERPRESHRGRVCGIGTRHALREGQARVRAEERLRARLLQP